MTKLRDALTFEDAIIKIVALIGWNGAAAAVGKSERLVRAWSDPDDDRSITIEHALRLDAAFAARGGEGAPFLSAYAYQLELTGFGSTSSDALVAVTARAAKECGEAIGALLEASRPGAPRQARDVALRESGEAIDILEEARRAVGAPALKAVS